MRKNILILRGWLGVPTQTLFFPAQLALQGISQSKIFTRLSEQMLSVHSLKAQNTVDLAYDDEAQQTVCCLKNLVLGPALHFDLFHI